MKFSHKINSTHSLHHTVKGKVLKNGKGLFSPLFLLTVFLFLNSNSIQAQITLTASSGTSSGTFTTLKGAFDAINAGTHQGAISIQINSSTTETASAVLNASGSGSASYTSINIYPTATSLSISGSLSAPLIDLSGADSVTIDGRVNATGSTKSLTITNTSAGSTAGTSTIRFINDATQNTVKYCTLKGATTETTGGIVLFSTTTLTTGNDNNTIDNNNITNSGSRSLNGIYALGTTGKENSGVIIQNNNIFDIFPSGTTAGNCISINGGNTGFTISGNSFYETTNWDPGSTGFNVIYINNTSGNNFDVSNNYIGGRAPSCGGSAWTKGTFGRDGLNCIRMNVGSTTASSIQGNTITNWNYNNLNNTRDWAGIYIDAGSVNIGTVQGNIIGAATGTGAVTGTNCLTLYGIYSISNNTLVIRNNVIGSLTNTTASNIRGIDASGSGALTIENNTIGSTSTANSINANSTSNTGVIGINVAGTGTISISGNTIANMSSNATSATNLTGIACSGNSNQASISGNFLRSISYTNTSSSGNLTGISLTAGTNTIYNNIISIGNNNPALLYGIASTGGTNKIYFNTVYLSGTPTSGAYSSAALYSSETNVRDIRNNIFVNGRSNGGATGSHYAVNFGSSVTGSLDYNNYYVSGTGGVLGNNNGSNSTSLPMVTSQDANSIITNPSFISTGTTASGYEPVVAGRGVSITGITTDYNGSSRGSTVTMGALLIACLNPSSGGTIAASQISYTTFDPVAFTSSAAPSGYIGTLEYKWQSSTTSSSSGFSDIASSNAATYDPGTVTQTTWFKRLSRVGCASNWSGAAESNVVEATICIPATNIINTPSATELTCIIPSISLTATGGASYSWSNGSTIVGATASLSVTLPGTYRVTVTAPNGCTSTADQVITQGDVTPPTAGINTPSATELNCTTTSITLTATGGGTYSWSNGSTIVGSSASLAVTSPATYVVTVTAANGCTATATQVITLYSVPAGITNNSGGNQLTCSRSAISLTATGGTDYAWSSGLGSNAQVSVTSPATYTVTVTAANGCTGTASITITQDITAPTPVITPSGSTTICIGASLTLTASGGTSYSWSQGSTTAAIQVSSTGNYSVVATGNNGCTASTSITVTVGDTQSPTVSCIGVGGAGSVNVYNKLAPGGALASADRSFANISRWAQRFTANTTGTISGIRLNIYRDQISTSGNFDIQLWSGTSTGLVPVAQLVTLKTLSWATDVPLNTSSTNTSAYVEVTSLNSYYTLVSGTTYWLVISQASNGPASKKWAVTSTGNRIAYFNQTTGTWSSSLTANLAAQITVSDPVRRADLSTCTYTTVGTEFDPASSSDNCGVASTSYALSGATTGTGSNTLAGTIFNKGVTTVTWSVADAFSNISTCSFTVTVTDKEAPVISLVGASSINHCQGQSYSDAGATATDNCDGNISANISVSGSVNTAVAGTYTLTYSVSDIAGNAATTVTRTVVVNTSPSAVITNNSGTTLLTCLAPSISLTASGGTTYAWSGGLGTNAGVTITSPGTYTATASYANGCSAAQSITITSNIQVLSLSGTNTVGSCSNNTSTVQVLVTGGTPPYSSSSNFAANGDCTYTVTDQMGCHESTLIPR